MDIFLQDLWPIDNLTDYKVHFARHNKVEEPLEVFVRDRKEWQGWQEHRPAKNDFNRPFIFSLIRFYHETDAWLFGGIFRVRERHEDGYDVELIDEGKGLIGRMKVHAAHRGRSPRVKLEKHYSGIRVIEVLREPYAGRQFPGFESIDLSFAELETLVKNERPDWKAALESVKGIYVISDIKTYKRYVGSAYGDQGVWSRWCAYASTGHGGNTELRKLVTDPSLDYCRANFRFSLLEHRAIHTADQVIFDREGFWKSVLFTRGDGGLNRN